MPIEGVDYAWDRPSVSGLVAAGKRFVVRYGGPGSDGKQLDAAELRALTAAGIAVVANAEGTASGFRGRTAGIAWARAAEEHFRGLGMPGDRPIYFSADWDVQSGEMDEVDAALRGAAEVIGAARVGLYGGYNVIRHAQAAGTARWLWQTYAWSGGRWASGTHIQQYRNHVSLAGGTVDLCQAMVADYGQWGQLREDDDMPTVGEIWSAQWGPTDDRETAADRLAMAAHSARDALAEVKSLRTAVTALAEARPGVDTDAILTRMDALAAEDRQRDADLAELVRQYQSGSIDAKAFADLLAARLAS